MVAVTDFRTVAEFARVISHNLWRLPGDFSTVAAIPESGRLPAALLGLQTGRPVRDLAEMIAPGAAPPEGAVLLVDDVCLTGTTMAAARDRLAERHPGVTVHRLAVYCRGGSEAAVDLSFERAPADPVFEWSLFRAPVVGRAMFDLDGILCGDCPAEDDDDLFAAWWSEAEAQAKEDELPLDRERLEPVLCPTDPACLEKQPVLLLFDGMDELGGPETRQRILEIAYEALSWGYRVLVTGRPTGFADLTAPRKLKIHAAEDVQDRIQGDEQHRQTHRK